MRLHLARTALRITGADAVSRLARVRGAPLDLAQHLNVVCRRGRRRVFHLAFPPSAGSAALGRLPQRRKDADALQGAVNRMLLLADAFDQAVHKGVGLLDILVADA